MTKGDVSIGYVYVDVKPPRREWRISQYRGDSITFQRVDKPTAFRFLATAELNDRHRYARKK